MKKKFLPNDSKGVALTVAIMVIIMLALLAGFVANFSYNQRKLLDSASGKRIKIYYLAQAGVVDAVWRIRSNYTTGIPGAPAGGFVSNPAWDPAVYSIDANGDGTNDTNIDIGPVTSVTTEQRQIVSTGRDI